MADPTDLFAYDEIARLLKRDIELAVVTESQLLRDASTASTAAPRRSPAWRRNCTADLGDGAVDFGDARRRRRA